MTKIEPSSLSHLIVGETEAKGGMFTVRSNRTNKDYTFKIVRKQFKESFYSHVYVEQEYLKFKYLGTYKNGLLWLKKDIVKTEAGVAASWLLRMVENKQFEKLEHDVEIFHLGHCLKCGKTLTDANSIETGIGPICRTKI